MLEEIKAFEAAGRWADLLQLAETLPQGDALARVHIALSKLQEDEARTGNEYRKALSYAQQAIAAADHGSLMWTWAQGRTAALAVDLGNYQLADRSAVAFLGALPEHPKAQALAPWVYATMGIVRKAQGRYNESIAFFALASAGGSAELNERVRLLTVWTLAESGRVVQAREALPSGVSHVPIGFLTAARAVVAAAAGNWGEARADAAAALRSRVAGDWKAYDVVQAAELMLILKRAAMYAGDFGEAAVWHLHTAATLFGWNADIMTSLLPTLPKEGGVWIDKAASSCGPAGYRRSGLLGTVG